MVWDDTEKRAKPKGIKGKALDHRPILGGMISTKTRALGWFRNRPMGWFWDGSGTGWDDLDGGGLGLNGPR